MVAQCPNCQSALPAGAHFCPSCGKQLTGRRRGSRVWAYALLAAVVVAGVIVVVALQKFQKQPVTAVVAATSIPSTPTPAPTATPSGLLTASGSGGGST